MELSALQEMFAEFLRIYKMINRTQIVETLKAELKTDQLKEIYMLSNGERSTREIVAALSSKSKCNHSTVARVWKRWALVGLVIPANRRGRYKAAFDLNEYGLADIVEETEEVQGFNEYGD